MASTPKSGGLGKAPQWKQAAIRLANDPPSSSSATTTLDTEPHASVRYFRTPEDYMATVGFTYRRTNVPSPGGFKAKLAQLNLGTIKVRLGESSPATIIGAVPDCHVFTMATQPNAQRALYGRDLPAGALCHHRPNELFHSTSSSSTSWPWAQISTSFEVLEECGLALVGRDLPLSRSDMAFISASSSAQERLLRLVTDAGRLAEARPEAAASPAASQALSGAILEALVACLAQGETTQDRAAVRRHHLVMTRLEAVIEGHAEEMLTLPQLCAAVGVAERTLHLVCQEFVGVGPMQYWRSIQLNKVRRALLAANPNRDRVAEIAMRHGFWALGRFAIAYRASFGELPSETLRRNKT